MILIKPHIMHGCRDWWDRKVGPTLLLRQHVDEAIEAGRLVVWWLPSGQLLTDRPRQYWTPEEMRLIERETYDRSWKRDKGYRGPVVQSREAIEAYFAMPERAIILEYGSNE